jgi:hypothetical protein
MTHRPRSLAMSTRCVRWRGGFAEHYVIKREVGVLRLLVEKTTAATAAAGRSEGKGGSDFGTGRDYDDDDTRSVATIVPHELERVEEEDAEQMAKQELLLEEDEEGRPWSTSDA